MARAVLQRFFWLAAMLLLLILTGLVSLPILQQCCPDPPFPWPEPPHRSFLETIFSMDMAPRLAALAIAAGIVSLLALYLIYLCTASMIRRDADGTQTRYPGMARAIMATFLVAVLYLYGFILTGYFQLGWFNLLWLVGVPALLAAFTGRDAFERRWGGFFLFVPGLVAMVPLMMSLGISLY